MNAIHSFAALCFLALPSFAAEDREYIQAVVAAQRARPAQIASTSRIAPASEPGTALVLHGKAFAVDGKTPLVGAFVFGYHTDRTGVYDRPGSPAHSWRLKGWAKTDTEGRFEFRTIRPGPYPRRNEAAHVHFTIFAADGARYHAGAALFGDDPLVREREREETRRDPTFGSVRPVRREGQTEHVDVNLKLAADQKF